MNQATSASLSSLSESTRAFYHRALEIFEASGIPHVLGGAYAMSWHAGIVRHTKDLDMFIERADLDRALEAFEREGFRTERTHPHWLAKIHSTEDAFVDLIFRSANGLCAVDESWFAFAEAGDLLGRPVKVCAVEDMIFSKSFVLARERFDGADINHLLRAKGQSLNWDRLLKHFEGTEELLLGHLFFFQFVYPCEAWRIPRPVVQALIQRAGGRAPCHEKLCRGTLVSWDQYAVDVEEWDYIDARILPCGKLTQDEVDQWTNAPK